VPARVLKLLSLAVLVATSAATPPARAAFPGDNGRIAYACARDICTMAPGGTDRKQVTTGGGAFEPAMSPDGRQILFTRIGFIWVINADGSGEHQIPGLPPARQPAWSPDGTRIAYSAASPSPPFRIWVAGVDGSNPLQITNQSSGDFSPAWSPDGTRIAYTRTNNSTDIYTADPNVPSAEAAYVFDSRTEDQPTWSPDGRAIAFTSNHGSGNDIYVQVSASGTATQVTSDPADDHDPSFSPDGSRIAFSSNRGGSPHIWSVGAGGVEQAPLDLTAAGGGTTSDDQPDWARPAVVPPPQIGSSLNAQPVKGRVLVKVPGASSAQPLEELDQVPIGSTFDTTHGTVKLTFSAGGGKTQFGRFNGGMFKTRQSSKNPLTELRMTGGNLGSCPKPRRGHLAAARSRGRRLFANVHGRFRTRGRNSTATVRGTEYLVKDSCKGTLTVVRSGTVVVRDLRKHRTVKLKRGGRYLAR
jgi:dipeptidyl aminopeptidase/acylaminoacyl peptidase